MRALTRTLFFASAITPAVHRLPRAVSDRAWLLAAVALLLAHAWYLRCVAEDAFIAFRYAQNLANGHGLVWNVGSPPVEGYTDFLWVVLGAVAIRAGVDVVIFGQALGMAAGVGATLVAFGAARRLLGLPGPVALLVPFLLAASGPFATWSASGMEMTLFTCLVLLATCIVAAFWQTNSGPGLPSAAALLVLATLTRPEGFMIAGLLLGSSAVLAIATRDRTRAVVAAIALYGALFAVYFLWRYSYFGYLLPNTFYAKTGGGLDQVLRGGLLAFLFYMQFVLPLGAVLLLAVWESRSSAAGLDREGWAAHARRHALVLLSAVVVATYTCYNIAVGGDYMAMHRFFVPLLPFIYLLFAAVAATVYRRISTPGHRRAYALLVVFVMAATFFPSTALERSFFHTPPQQHGNYRGVQTERWHVARLSEIGRFFQKYRRDPSESLATSAIGAIGYYADMRVLDMHGLVDTYIAHLPPPPDMGRRRPGHARQDLAYTLSLKPTYVMFSRDLTPAPIELWRYVPDQLEPDVARDYVHRSVPLDDPANGESGYFTFFERRESAQQREQPSTAGTDAQR